MASITTHNLLTVQLNVGTYCNNEGQYIFLQSRHKNLFSLLGMFPATSSPRMAT